MTRFGGTGRKPVDIVALLEEQDATRDPDLVPVRHRRMAVSPFTFYRGAAKIMPPTSSTHPGAGPTVQLWGGASSGCPFMADALLPSRRLARWGVSPVRLGGESPVRFA